MRPWTWLPVLLLCLGGCSALPAAPGDHQVIVALNDAAGQAAPPAGSRRSYRGDQQWPVSLHTRVHASRLVRKLEVKEADAWTVHSLGLYCLVLDVPAARTIESLAAELADDPRVVQVQPVHAFTGLLTEHYDDPLVDAQYGPHVARLAAVHALTTGRGVRVGIIDGQVDENHPDLRGQISRQLPAADDAPIDELMHGTAVAGVIVAAADNGEGLVGLAPSAEVTVYAACRDHAGTRTRCSTVTLAEALEQAIDNHSQIINLSLAGPEDWLLERLLDHARDQQIVLVAASNAAHPQRNFPGSLPYVHAAGSGVAPWFATPERFSTRAGGGYQVFFGSSIAAAGATGMAALLRSLYSDVETDRLLTALLSADCADVAPGPGPGDGDDCAP